MAGIIQFLMYFRLLFSITTLPVIFSFSHRTDPNFALAALELCDVTSISS